MIPRTGADTFLAISNNKAFPLVLNDGDVVDVKILNRLPNGLAKVGVRGFIFTATAPENLKSGAVFKMLVRVSDNKLFLSPLLSSVNADTPKNDFFSQLGLQRTPLLEAVIGFLKELNVKIDGDVAQRLAQYVTNFKHNEKKSAFLVSILHEKGIVLSDADFERIYDVLFSDDDPTDKQFNHQSPDAFNELTEKQVLDNDNLKEDEELLKLINHTNGGRFHWILVPFEKKFSSIFCKGSCAMLLDLENKDCKKIALRLHSSNSNWTFIIEDDVCQFEVNTKSEFSEKEYVALLEKEFVERGLNIKPVYGIFDSQQNSIDISV